MKLTPLLNAVNAILELSDLRPETVASIVEAIHHDQPVRIWITEAEAADLLSVDRRYLGRWRETGTNHEGSPFPFVTGRWSTTLLRYDRLHLQTWIEAHIQIPTHQ